MNKEETMESISEMFPSVISAEEVKNFYELVVSGPSRIRSREEKEVVHSMGSEPKANHLLDKLA